MCDHYAYQLCGNILRRFTSHIWFIIENSFSGIDVERHLTVPSTDFETTEFSVRSEMVSSIVSCVVLSFARHAQR